MSGSGCRRGGFPPRPPLVETFDERSSSHADAAVKPLHFDAVPVVGKLTHVLAGPLGALVLLHLRARPRQARSIESVERLVTAAAMTVARKNRENISIEKLSVDAGVTPQAAYRYFQDADALIRTALRCVVIRDHEQMIDLLTGRVVADASEMAHIVVGHVLDCCERLHRYPAHLQESALREYRQVGYDASRLLAELICKDADAGDVRHTLDVVKLSVALTATVAVATSTSSKRTLPLRGGKVEHMVANLFVTVLQSSGSSFDDFREIGIAFETYVFDDDAE